CKKTVFLSVSLMDMWLNPIAIKLRKANTPKRKNWHPQVKMYIFCFGGTSKCWVDGHLILFFIMHL
ncbi:hypothetical protein ACWGJ1_24620, partial [Bacillus wiedmannii]